MKGGCLLRHVQASNEVDRNQLINEWINFPSKIAIQLNRPSYILIHAYYYNVRSTPPWSGAHNSFAASHRAFNIPFSVINISQWLPLNAFAIIPWFSCARTQQCCASERCDLLIFCIAHEQSSNKWVILFVFACVECIPGICARNELAGTLVPLFESHVINLPCIQYLIASSSYLPTGKI